MDHKEFLKFPTLFLLSCCVTEEFPLYIFPLPASQLLLLIGSPPLSLNHNKAFFLSSYFSSLISFRFHPSSPGGNFSRLHGYNAFYGARHGLSERMNERLPDPSRQGHKSRTRHHEFQMGKGEEREKVRERELG